MIMNRRITGRTVLYAMLGFFGVIFSVNGLFVYFALSSWPGLSTDQPYEKGIKYNRTLAKAEEQIDTGWVSRASLSIQGGVIIVMTDRSGGVVSDLDVNGIIKRPARAGLDQKFSLLETVPGQYESQVSPVLPGRWRLEVRAIQNSKQVYFKVHDLMVRE